MNNKVYLHKIATVVPDFYYTQDFALKYQTKLLCDTSKKKLFLDKIYKDTAIHKRHSVISDFDKHYSEHEFYPQSEDLEPEPSTMKRNDLFITESNSLSLKAVKKLLDTCAFGVKDKISHVITVSCTGFAAPGFDFHLVKELQLKKSVDRFNIGFMGCYAAFPAMKLASSICKADPEARVLVVNVELCSLHYQKKFDTDTIVANALFADGVAAYLISSNESDSEGSKIIFNTFHSHYTDNSESDMAWKIGEHGFDMKLSSYVPKIIDQHIGGVMDDLFNKANITQKDISIWAVHPGGKAILEKFSATMDLKKTDLQHSYDILWNYGNMSSSTIMFVLNEVLNSSKSGKIFSAGFGPGLTIETAIMEKV
ncbi:MAG: hypothetical protein A2015_09685 [Spirochaetes bacterium GWF1_31_7]|nr:MAG: hypothetical protein A2Y30_04490 [Spirochaetes bacterium GWE1_32_154]OHD47557.1 MAG: hypothetical protein A2015_09685 [Spirochaetes bacterium GWF1_31_7]OHD52047.1 MAG: hypothetical protein A2Y29_17445 [Spirochaetes bacterium GWE2_31_10]OHD72791.1 MAG: hypothetical protein A2355_07625 [Spirochaetes bacterium RIFOXYB1_FULL_32_8]HBD93466.1 type III polyketide synthase [Spirochaetia bacterium]